MRGRLALLLAALCAGACVGVIDEQDRAGEPGGGSGGSSYGPTPEGFTPPTSMTRRLTKEQYAYSLEDVLGVNLGGQLDLLPDETRTEGFSNNAIGLVVSSDHADAYFELAELAADAVQVSVISAHSDCQELGNADCEKSFVAQVGRRLFRRPLAEAEVDRFRKLFDTAEQEQLDFEGGARLVLMAILQAPQFLYRLEDAIGDDVRTITGFEMASRLAYLIWQSAPDEALLTAAAAGDLDSAAGVTGQAQRLLDESTGSRRTTARFVRDWLALDSLANTSRADLSSALALQMLDSAVDSYQQHVWTDGSPLGQVLTTSTLSLTPEVAGFIDVPAQGSGLARYQLASGGERAGLLTHPGVLTAISDRDVGGIVARGLFVLEHMLCRDAVSPPPDLNTSAFTSHLGPEATERDYSEDRISNDDCAGCHAQFDPLAYAFERFDGVGRYSTENEHGKPLRADGEFTTAEGKVTFSSAPEYVALLSGAPDVGRCVTEKHLQFALGQRIEKEQEAAVDQIHERYLEHGGTYSAMVLAIVAHDVFRKAKTE